MAPEERKPEPLVSGAPKCVDDNDQPIRCAEDNECCSGFVCGIDPELSSRIKHCIYAGQ